MATIGYPMQEQRPGAMRRAVVFFPRYGKIHASKWPRPRGLPKDSEQLARLQWMRDMAREYKLSDSLVMQAAQEAAVITKARPQDWWTRYTSGRMWYMTGPSGKLMVSMVFLYCVSTAIDLACAAPGALAIRATDGWRPLPAGNTGAILMMGNTLPYWSDGTMPLLDQPSTDYSGAVSDALDSITADPGSLLVRDADWWVGVPPGTIGQVLTIGADGLPSWQ